MEDDTLASQRPIAPKISGLPVPTRKLLQLLLAVQAGLLLLLLANTRKHLSGYQQHPCTGAQKMQKAPKPQQFFGTTATRIPVESVNQPPHTLAWWQQPVTNNPWRPWWIPTEPRLEFAGRHTASATYHHMIQVQDSENRRAVSNFDLGPGLAASAYVT